MLSQFYKRPMIRSIFLFGFLLGGKAFAAQTWPVTVAEVTVQARIYVGDAQSDSYNRVDDPAMFGCVAGVSKAAVQAAKLAESAALQTCRSDKYEDQDCKKVYLNYRIGQVGNAYRCLATIGFMKTENLDKHFEGGPQ